MIIVTSKLRVILKWSAVVMMVFDHANYFLNLNSSILFLFGRFSYPLFVILLIMGTRTTKSIDKYFWRLLVFGVISQVPYSLAFGLYSPNIFFSLALGVLFIKYDEYFLVWLTITVVVALLFPWHGFPVTVLLVIVIYRLYDLVGNRFVYVPVASRLTKWFFYVFYPVHLLFFKAMVFYNAAK